MFSRTRFELKDKIMDDKMMKKLFCRPAFFLLWWQLVRVVGLQKIIFCSLLLAGAPLQAQLPDNPQFQQAYDFFVRERFDQAIVTMNAFLARPDLARENKIVAYQVITFSYYSLKDGKASATIRQILEIDIKTEADPNLFKPVYTTFFGYQKAQEVSEVQLRSNPPGAAVFLGDTFIGTAPLDTLLLANNYAFRLELPGYRPKSVTQLIRGGPNTLEYELAPKSKNLKWYATGGVLLTGGAVYFLANKKEKEVLSDLPAPPSIPERP